MIKQANTKWCPRRALRAARQFGPWVVISLLVVAVFGQADSAALSGLFQSPPTETPTTEPLPTIEATPTLTPTIEVTPTLTPTIEVPPTPEPTSTPLPDVIPSPMPELLETPTVTATLPVDTGSAELDSEEVPGRYPDEGSNLEFEWGMLFDSMALGLSYGWLCCGVVFMLALPISFLALWVAARRRRQRIE